jgi:hypothetical protein
MNRKRYYEENFNVCKKQHKTFPILPLCPNEMGTANMWQLQIYKGKLFPILKYTRENWLLPSVEKSIF